MASVGAYNVLAMWGSLTGPGVAMTQKVREGVDGAAFTKIGLRANQDVIITYGAFDSTADLRYAKALCAALKGSLQTITDQFGNAFYNMMVLDYQILEEKPHVTGVGSLAGTNYHMLIQWYLQATQVL